MSALLRRLAAAGLVYAGFAVCFPDWEGTAWPVMTLSLIAGGAVGVFFLRQALDLSEGAAKVGLELLFVGGVALWIGYTMPQKSGKAPLTQWAEGARPRREDARRGLRRLGLDPEGSVPSRLVGLFPR